MSGLGYTDSICTIIVCFRCFRGFIENNKKYRLLPGNHAIVNQKRKHSCVVGTFLTSPTSPKPVLCFALQHCSKIQLKNSFFFFFFLNSCQNQPAGTIDDDTASRIDILIRTLTEMRLLEPICIEGHHRT